MDGGLAWPKFTRALTAFFTAAVLLIAGCSAGAGGAGAEGADNVGPEGSGRLLTEEEVLAEYAAVSYTHLTLPTN